MAADGSFFNRQLSAGQSVHVVHFTSADYTAWSNPAYQGFGRPRKPKLLREQRLTVEGRSLSLPEEAWREVTVAEGTQADRGMYGVFRQGHGG